MKQIQTWFSWSNCLMAGMMLVFLATLYACSGGGGSAPASGSASVSTTTGSSSGSNAGTASGTVTGLGSIVVDGHEYTETPATQYRTDAFGVSAAMAADEVQLGHHVIVSFDSSGNLILVEVAPDVEGTVSSITSSVTVGSTATPAITVAGVLVVANTDATQGPVTSYGGGYTALSSVQVGDNVEVHGLLRSSNGTDYVQATFIGKRPSFVGTRITGVVAAYSASANTFTLGSGTGAVSINATGATVLPAGASVANGDVVSVWSSGALTMSGGTEMLTANVVNVRSNLGVAGDTLSVSGAISNYTSQASFTLNGITVDASAVTLPAGVTALSNGMLVVASGTLNSSGTLVATQLRVFASQTSSAPSVMLQGTITDFVSASNFTVRGVIVDGSQNPTYNAGFGATNLQDGAFVKITGTLTNNVVVASSIQFGNMPAMAVLDLKATVQSYDATSGALGLSLKLPGSSQATTVQVTLASSVNFNNGSAALLTAGQTIRIHAVYDSTSNTFVITSITFLPPQPPSATSNAVLLSGVITAVSPTSGTPTSFVLHGLTINVGSASVVPAMGASGTLAVGDMVVVYAQTSAGNTLTASIIMVAQPTMADTSSMM